MQPNTSPDDLGFSYGIIIVYPSYSNYFFNKWIYVLNYTVPSIWYFCFVSGKFNFIVYNKCVVSRFISTKT